MPPYQLGDAEATDRRAAGCAFAVMNTLVAVVELAVVIGCFLVLLVRLETTGGWFVATTGPERWQTWFDASIVALLVGVGSSAYYLFYALHQQRFLLLTLQCVLLLIIILGVAGFHHDIPVPPGLDSTSIPW